MTLDNTHIILLALNAVFIIMFQLERHRAIKREEKLVQGVLADTLTEYNLTDPDKQIKLMEKESKLAERAYDLENLNKPDERHMYPVN